MKKLLLTFTLLLTTQTARAADLTYYVDTDCGTPGNGSDSVCDGNAGDPYATLAAFDTAEATDLVTAGDTITVKVFGSAADGPVTFDTDWTTSSTNYLRIETDSALSESVHSGTYPTSSYRIEGDNFFAVIRVEAQYIELVGLPIKSTATTNAGRGIFLRGNDDGALIKDCIIVGNLASNANAAHIGIDLENVFADSGRTINVINNLIYDWEFGVTNVFYTNDVLRLYNNGIYNVDDNALSFTSGASGDELHWKNNWAESCVNDCYDWTITWTTETNTTNLSEDGTESSSTGTCTFENEAGDDFRIASGDSTCKEAGTDLSSDTEYAFSDDFVGTTRTASWSLGPYELDAASSGVEAFRRRIMQ